LRGFMVTALSELFTLLCDAVIVIAAIPCRIKACNI
jgi:hypothetical protein